MSLMPWEYLLSDGIVADSRITYKSVRGAIDILHVYGKMHMKGEYFYAIEPAIVPFCHAVLDQMESLNVPPPWLLPEDDDLVMVWEHKNGFMIYLTIGLDILNIEIRIRF